MKEIKNFKPAKINEASCKSSRTVNSSDPDTFKTFCQKVLNFPSETLSTKSLSGLITKSISYVLILFKPTHKEFMNSGKMSTKFWWLKKRSLILLKRSNHPKNKK